MGLVIYVLYLSDRILLYNRKGQQIMKYLGPRGGMNIKSCTATKK